MLDVTRVQGRRNISRGEERCRPPFPPPPTTERAASPRPSAPRTTHRPRQARWPRATRTRLRQALRPMRRPRRGCAEPSRPRPAGWPACARPARARDRIHRPSCGRRRPRRGQIGRLRPRRGARSDDGRARGRWRRGTGRQRRRRDSSPLSWLDWSQFQDSEARTWILIEVGALEDVESGDVNVLLGDRSLTDPLPRGGLAADWSHWSVNRRAECFGCGAGRCPGRSGTSEPGGARMSQARRRRGRGRGVRRPACSWRSRR
jgi:hypothetical protein